MVVAWGWVGGGMTSLLLHPVSKGQQTPLGAVNHYKGLVVRGGLTFTNDPYGLDVLTVSMF